MTLTRRSWLRVTTTAAAAMVPAFTLGAEGAQALPAVTVHKDPSCGCCSLWIGHMERAGFRVTATDTTNMPALHAKLGVPAHVQSCHTAVVDGYLVEGHVPADEVKRLLHLPVRVSGLVSYFANGRPRAILRMERIKGLSGPLEPGRQYWGSLPNLSRGEDTSAALRRGFGG